MPGSGEVGGERQETRWVCVGWGFVYLWALLLQMEMSRHRRGSSEE